MGQIKDEIELKDEIHWSNLQTWVDNESITSGCILKPSCRVPVSLIKHVLRLLNTINSTRLKFASWVFLKSRIILLLFRKGKDPGTAVTHRYGYDSDGDGGYSHYTTITLHNVLYPLAPSTIQHWEAHHTTRSHQISVSQRHENC